MADRHRLRAVPRRPGPGRCARRRSWPGSMTTRASACRAGGRTRDRLRGVPGVRRGAAPLGRRGRSCRTTASGSPTAREGRGGAARRICRATGSRTVTQPRSPTTTGKIERFHQTLGASCSTTRAHYPELEAQATVDDWVPNTTSRARIRRSPRRHRPSASTRAAPAMRPPRAAAARLSAPGAAPEPPAAVAPAEPEPRDADASADDAQQRAEVLARGRGRGRVRARGAGVGNMWVAGGQLWFGPQRAGARVTIWADTESST